MKPYRVTCEVNGKTYVKRVKAVNKDTAKSKAIKTIEKQFVANADFLQALKTLDIIPDDVEKTFWDRIKKYIADTDDKKLEKMVLVLAIVGACALLATGATALSYL